MVGKTSVLALLLVVTPVAVSADGTEANVYVYDDAITIVVDVDQFETSGDVTFLDGMGESCMTEPGPAPDPYPRIRFLGPCFEQLGASNTNMDGISFFTRGNHGYWKKNGRVFVLWKIHVPSADERAATDFEEDITLSMWVDWDQNQVWDRGELVIRKSVNIGDYVPAGDTNVYLNCLTSFRVPDITRSAATNRVPANKFNSATVHLWVRGSVSYDNAAVSPDGDQLYGEFEDYRVGYGVKDNKKNRGGSR